MGEAVRGGMGGGGVGGGGMMRPKRGQPKNIQRLIKFTKFV